MRQLSVLVVFAAGLCGGSACGSSEPGDDSRNPSGGSSSTAGQGGAGAGVAGASTAGGGGSGVPGGASNAAGTAAAGTPNSAGSAGTAGVGGSSGGSGPAPGSCGAEAGAGAEGPYADVSSRYTAPTSPARAPILDASAELHADHVFEGTLEDSDAPFVRVSDSCGRPPPGYTYTVDAFAVELVGPGPHNLVVDTCDSELLFEGGAFHAIDTVVMAYQDSDGSDHPLDLDDACPHLLAQDDDGCPLSLGPSLLRMTGLREGTVQIAVTTFGSPPTTPWPYVLHVRSDTSCE